MVVSALATIFRKIQLIPLRMNWFTKLATSTLGRKLLMALTGLFLIVFLTVHLIGNLQLLKGDGGLAFNVYAKFMTTNSLIKVVSYVNYAFILIHIAWAVMLTRRNNQARGKVGYAVANKASHWTSRSMMLLGILITLFLLIHLKGFWYEMHWGSIGYMDHNGEQVKDLYAVVAQAYSNIVWVIVYVAFMAVVGFHLWHGFASIFQTLGLNHSKYNSLIRFVGRTFAVVVPIGFAIIPVVMYLQNS